jgi:hypothetical protein
MKTDKALQASEGTTVAKALLQASERLGLGRGDVAEVIGVSPSTMTRVFDGTSRLQVRRKEGQLALLLLRVFRSLDSALGGDERAVRTWFTTRNLHLRGVPSKLVRTPQGLVHVADYLDAVRGTL